MRNLEGSWNIEMTPLPQHLLLFGSMFSTHPPCKTTSKFPTYFVCDWWSNFLYSSPHTTQSFHQSMYCCFIHNNPVPFRFSQLCLRLEPMRMSRDVSSNKSCIVCKLLHQQISQYHLRCRPSNHHRRRGGILSPISWKKAKLDWLRSLSLSLYLPVLSYWKIIGISIETAFW